MIYEIRGKQAMFDSELSATKCYGWYGNIATHYDINKSKSVYENNV